MCWWVLWVTFLCRHSSFNHRRKVLTLKTLQSSYNLPSTSPPLPPRLIMVNFYGGVLAFSRKNCIQAKVVNHIVLSRINFSTNKLHVTCSKIIAIFPILLHQEWQDRSKKFKTPVTLINSISTSWKSVSEILLRYVQDMRKKRRNHLYKI